MQDVLQDLARECIILAEILQDLVRIALFLQLFSRFECFIQDSCKTCLELSMVFYHTKRIRYFSKFCTKLYSEFSSRFRTKHFAKFQKMTRMILSKSKVTLDKNCLILNFYSNKLSRYKTHDLRKFLIPDALKHVGLQNMFNRCKVHQILPLMVEYACFLVKCINCQNVMCIQKIYLQDLARFLQVMKILQDS